jgi:glycosyltransferase involved in cell wall biosynthesis
MNPMWRGRVMKVRVWDSWIESALNHRAKNIFVIPDNFTLPSGGNIYNRLLVEALKRVGFEVTSLPFAEARKRFQSLEKYIYWVDTLCVGFIDDVFKIRRSNEDIYLIVHHLKSLEPDLKGEAYEIEMAREQDVFDKVSGLLVTSPFTREVLHKRGLSEKPVIVVPPALSLFPSRNRKTVKGFVAILVANLIPRKGVLEFLEVLGKRVTEEDSFQLRIVGGFDIDPEYSQCCLSIVERNPLFKNSVTFSGPLSSARLKRAYESSSVFISSSNMETYGMAIQEARAFGLPILALEAGFVKAHIDPGKNGHVYESIDELCDACLVFMREPDRLNQLQEGSRISSDANPYTWDNAAQRFLEQIKEIAG